MTAEFLGSLFITCVIAACGLYVLTHVTMLATRLQKLYIRAASQRTNKYGLFVFDPKTWEGPFARFVFRGAVIFFGVWLLIVAYTAGFGPVVF